MTAIAIALVLTSSLTAVFIASGLARWCFEDGLYGLGIAAVLIGLTAILVGVAGSVAIASGSTEHAEIKP